mmetsp:Transcript_27956/g.76859  ORF Transcript_27956/g.76859 Transcript_27956/m.76859 type:complete len:512 (-) Transcript_27956:114-1649(-)|eukprot:CAMPEP_0179081372 /NCGR_PEP_ID=MMETSP0796-20121207/36635_1 /TAXON_ID=73915 /ORGANISM="Pyrodinium bahamense, Strain pbaha01" /LENGTH=511 /DNA_ID=CAMNT_0020778759 /DNA_START=63 /DNA_END=1598 /DNA_ORIENTATION=-
MVPSSAASCSEAFVALRQRQDDTASAPAHSPRRPSIMFVPRRRQTYHNAQEMQPLRLAAPASAAAVAIVAPVASPSPRYRPDPATAAAAVDKLRQEIASSVRQERLARCSEVAELRAALQELKERLATASLGPNAVSASGEPATPAAPALTAGPASLPEQLAEVLREERESRCERIAELHARITREVADMACSLEQRFSELSQEIEATRCLLEEQRSSLERSVRQESELRNIESEELRAIMDAVWHKAASLPPEAPGRDNLQRLFAYPEGGTKEFVGDADDIFTLYDMVREVLADSVQLHKDVAEEREERELDIARVTKRSERFEYRLNALQAIVRSASGGGHAPQKRQRTLATLAEQDPKWGRLLQDPDRLFSRDDIIDKAYKKYLSDVLALMTKHDCTFKRAVELSTADDEVAGARWSVSTADEDVTGANCVEVCTDGAADTVEQRVEEQGRGEAQEDAEGDPLGTEGSEELPLEGARGGEALRRKPAARKGAAVPKPDGDEAAALVEH